MMWVKIDCEFYDHPRWATAPAESGWLWLAAMAWCSRNDSLDGYIPAVKLAGLVPIKNLRRTIADLVARGAFHDHDGGYLIHDYAEYQQNAKVQRVREVRAAAGKKGANARWHSNGIANAMANAMPEKCPGTGTDVLQTDDELQSVSPERDSSSGIMFDLHEAWTTQVCAIAATTAAQNRRQGPPDQPRPWIARVAIAMRTERRPELDAAWEMGLQPEHAAQRLLDSMKTRVLPVPEILTVFFNPDCACEGSGLVNLAPEGAPATYADCSCASDTPYGADAVVMQFPQAT